MIPDDLDRMLSSEKLLEPSRDFVQEVMGCVRTEASRVPRIPFPWISVLILALAMGVPVGALLWKFPVPLWTENLLQQLSGWASAPTHTALMNALPSILGSLLGTTILVWLSFKLVGAKN
jgi:hypothetical protein